MDQHRHSDANERRSRTEPGSGVLVFVPEARAELPLTWSGVLAALRRDRWLHLSIFAFCLAVAAAFAFLTEPVYRAQAVLLPVSASEQDGLLSGLQGSGLGSLAGLAGIELGAGDEFRKEALALLTSRDFTVRFIEDEKLLPLLFAKKWDERAQRWRVEESKIPTIDQGLERFDRSVRKVTEDRRNGLVLVSIEWPDRQRATQWANTLVARANAELRRRTIDDSERRLEFLRRELAKTDVVGLQQTLYRMMESELRKITIASVREQYAFRVVDPARVPLKNRQVRPRRALDLLLGFGVALAFSIWLLWMRVPRTAQ